MVGENFHQGVVIFGLEEVFDSPLRQLREGFVRRRKDRERAWPLQRLDQAGGLDGSHQRRVIRGVHRVIDDILAWIHGHAADHRGFLLFGVNRSSTRDCKNPESHCCEYFLHFVFCPL
jgi:hypothetical protein